MRDDKEGAAMAALAVGEPRSAGRYAGLAAACLALLLALMPRAALAIPADFSVDQLHHQRWAATDGAPVVVHAMAQSGDGALWLGAPSGLFRFDGVQFQRIQAPDEGGRPFGSVSALMALPDGTLLIGLGFGGAYHWQAGRYTAIGEDQGLPSDRKITTFALGKDGRVWAATTAGLFVREGGRWRQAVGELHNPKAQILNLAVDGQGTLWTSSADGVYRLAHDAKQAVQVEGGMTGGFLATMADGSVWYAGGMPSARQALLRLDAPAGQTAAGLHYPPDKYLGRFLADRDGGLWIAYGDGLLRLQQPSALRGFHAYGKPPAGAQLFTAEHGLSGRVVISVFEDRDGSVWVSTESGLDRFRTPRLRPQPVPVLAAMRGAQDGTLLMCTFAGAATQDGPVPALVRAGHHCEAMDEDPSGKTWWAINQRLWWWQGERSGEIPLPGEAGEVLGIPALKVDGAGTLWISLVRGGLFQYRDGRWTRVEPARDGMPAGRPLTMERDAAGRLWLGYPDSQVVLIDGGKARTWGPGQGLQVGNVQFMRPRGQDMLVGGSEGLVLVQEARNRVTRLSGEDGETFQSVTGIVFDKQGFGWVQVRNGILRVSAQALDEVASQARPHLPLDRFDHVDGLRGQAPHRWPWSSAAQDARGRLWFTTTASAVTIDPTRVWSERKPPEIELRGLRVDGRAAPLDDGRPLPVGLGRIELSYAAIDIAMPERVRYRYRLDGLDQVWQTTAARNATYTNLAPGSYRFRVAAANENGIWSESEAAIQLSVPAAFHQTGWFYALCALSLALLAWVAHRWRLHQLMARMRLRSEARLQERERIARELHDTLLQSTQGLMLSVQALADRTPADHPDKIRIERALALADQAVHEGRRKVLDLRAGDLESDLADLLADLASELDERGPAAVAMQVEGEPQPMPASVRGEVLRMGQEALLNAHRHAQARRIEVTLGYRTDALHLRVADDGIGMNPALMDGSQDRPGHFGLAGLRERAATLNATLDIRGGDAGGTVVELHVPAARAYADGPGGLPQ